MQKQSSRVKRIFLIIASPLMMLALTPSALASTAYGTLNNFDCVNDVIVNNQPVECHGFEIEIEDIHSTDITYTYDYNHYGTPTIKEDNSDPAHPRVSIRWAAKKNPDGTWSAYTAIPSGPISPTDGHQFTNPSVNFGGEHFGVGYYGAPTAVRNFWLIDDGVGNLIHGPPVNISTPTFVYYPPVGLQPAQVQAVVVPPPPPAPPVLRFGEASWVKDIKTTTHNPNKVELQDLVDPDPDNPAAPNWANGEPAEVETEWRILQTEFANAANPKGELAGIPEDLPDGDEIITRRYEFYKYIGPKDAESGEAMGDAVGPDGIHGMGSVTYNDHIDPLTGEWVEVTVDLSTIEVVGEFFGAQMSGFDVAPVLGLVDHIPDGELGVAYADRSVVIAGGAAFLATVYGALPDGTTFDEFTGIFSGTPTVAGVFIFTVDASDTTGALVSKTYTVTISEPPIPPGCITDAECADADACTADVCVNGDCLHTPVAGCCNMDGECDDGNACTVDLCANHACAYEIVPACCLLNGECDDANACTVDVCVNFVCEHQPVAACCNADGECDDGDACTRDACVDFACIHEIVPACCHLDSECADGNDCTLDTCVNNVCMYENVPACCTLDADCTDTNECTLDVCLNHLCRNDAVAGCCLMDGECDDANACTVDACLNHACEHAPIIGCCQFAGDCDDGDACTLDFCQANTCVHEVVAGCCTTDAQCADANPCTLDLCKAAANLCEHQPVPGCCVDDAACADGDACTIDTCVNQLCEHNPIAGCCTSDADCVDADACTTDRCVENVCEHAPVAGCCAINEDCDDGVACTIDACVEGVCRHAPDDAACADSVSCTRDHCDPALGCVSTPDDSLCDDGLYCNGWERCHPVSGCRPANRKPCPPPFCDEEKNVCRKQSRVMERGTPIGD